VSHVPHGPLFGRKILVTRAEEKGSRFGRLLEERGAEVLQVPLIRLEDPDSWEPLDSAFARIASFQHLLFTSATTVDRFFERFRPRAAAGTLPDSLRITVVGPRTAQAVARWGHGAKRVAEVFQAEGMLDALPESDVAGREILFPRAQEARELLVEELTRRGARVTVVPVYRNVLVEESRQPLLKALHGGRVDVVTFTAASAVRHFVELLGAAEAPTLMRGVKAACLGEVTADEARSRGLQPVIIPARSTLEDLAEAIVEHYLSLEPSR
jgi:uroporphyrinogen III methyltransferase / synthase